MTVTSGPNYCQSLTPMIAIIDDDNAVRDAMRFLLTAYGFPVVAYESGAEFLAELPSIALLIVDEDMPGLNGLQVIRQFRRALGASVPVLMFSAALSSDIEARAADVGVTRFLHKPLALNLVQAVQSALTDG